MRIFLIGPMGSGKSTVGAALAKRLQLPFIDLDQSIEKQQGKSIAALFKEKGEAYFRQCESEELQSIIQTTPAAVIATGGGTPCFNHNMHAMNAVGTTIYLKCTTETLRNRLSGDVQRPLLQQADFSLEKHLDEREEHYASAHYTVSNDSEIKLVVDAILNLINGYSTSV